MRPEPTALLLATALMSLAAVSPARAQSTSCSTALVPAPPAPTAPDVLRSRRAALAHAIGTGVAVVPAASPARRPGGEPRPSSHFEYLTGLELSSGWLVLVAPTDDGDGAYLFLEPQPEVAGTTVAGVAAGIDSVRCLESAAGDFARWLRDGDATTPPVPLLAPIGMQSALDPTIAAAVDTSGLEIVNLWPELARLRAAKDAEELRRLRKAAELSALGAVEGMRTARAGLGEADVQAAIESAFRTGGAARTSFPSIVASGSNALELHYSDNASVLGESELLLTDVGAEFEGYAGDVTRTYPVSGRFNDRQRELYELVLSTQQAAIEAVQPGVTIEELNRIAREHMASHSADLCGAETCDTYFIHGLSHHLGLDVHDPGLPDQPLAPGMVLTIEPGIYIPAEGIGIRIEDDVLVTPAGHEVLSVAAPKSIRDIEALMAEAG